MMNALKAILFLSVLFLTFGCSRQLEKWQLKKAIGQVENQEFGAAVDNFSRVMRRSPEKPIAVEAARRGAKVSLFDLKDYKKAAEFYRHLVLHSQNNDERLMAQKSLVEIYFEKLGNYEQALQELSRLLPLVESNDRAQYQLSMAKSYFSLNNFSQALSEIDDLLTRNPAQKVRYEANVFKFNLLQASRRLDDAIKVLRSTMAEFPALAKRDNLGMILAISYEEKGDLAQAVALLEGLKANHSNPEFIQSRIENLKERMANQPGAQGFKK